MNHDAPIAFEYIPGDVGGERHGKPGYVYAVDFTFFEVMRHRRITSPSVRIHADPARAKDFTVAHFEQATFEFIGHVISPFRDLGREIAAVRDLLEYPAQVNSTRRRTGQIAISW